MAASINLNCASCNSRHTFCLPGTEFFTDGAEYEYTCPVTSEVVRRTVSDWAMVVPGCPASSVAMRATGR